MTTQCKKCGAQFPNTTIECPSCKTFHPENIQAAAEAQTEPHEVPAPGSQMMGFPSPQGMSVQILKLKQQVDKLSVSKDAIAVDIAQLVILQVKGWFEMWKYLMVLTAVMIFGCAFLVVRIYTGTDQLINDAVDEQVSQKLVIPALNKMIVEITEMQLKQKMVTVVDPAIDEFKKGVKAMRHNLQSSKTEFDLKYEELSVEVQIMNDRRHLLKLADHALAGSNRAYRELVTYREKAPLIELLTLATEQIAQVETFYKNKTDLLDVHVNYRTEDGKGLMDSAVPTAPLIKVMLNSPHWKVRARAARILGLRVEPAVADFLLSAAAKDPRLEVVRQALRSFAQVTGYKTVDVLLPEAAQSWWDTYNPSADLEDAAAEDKRDEGDEAEGDEFEAS